MPAGAHAPLLMKAPFSLSELSKSSELSMQPGCQAPCARSASFLGPPGARLESGGNKGKHRTPKWGGMVARPLALAERRTSGELDGLGKYDQYQASGCPVAGDRLSGGAPPGISGAGTTSRAGPTSGERDRSRRRAPEIGRAHV